MYSTSIEGIPIKYAYKMKHKCPICGNTLEMVFSAIYVKRGTEEESKWIWLTPHGRIAYLSDGYFVLIELFCTHCKFQTRMNDYHLVDPEKKPYHSASNVSPRPPQHAIKYLTYVDPSYLYKLSGKKVKRRCPDCGRRLLTSYSYKIVEPDSPEAKNYDFTIAGKKIEGRIEFRKGFFICPRESCMKEITFDEMHEIEKNKNYE